jgi:hypothetical protein
MGEKRLRECRASRCGQCRWRQQGLSSCGRETREIGEDLELVLLQVQQTLRERRWFFLVALEVAEADSYEAKELGGFEFDAFAE